MDYQVSPELITIYLEDARGHLDTLDRALLALEREGFDVGLVAATLGPLHTLKGNSGMIGFSGIKDYVHRLEDVLASVRDGGILPTPALFDGLLGGAAVLRDAVEGACREGSEVRDLAYERRALEALLSARSEEPAPVPPGPLAAAAPAAGAAARGEPASALPHAAARSSVVRVNFAQLDHLLNLVGELIIYRTKLQELGREIAAELGGTMAARQLQDVVHHVARASADLQEAVMDVRMLPVRQVFERFPRLVRDLARQQGKQVELILEGEDTRVDKAIIDEIGEPLVHLIRNAVDHGVETPEARVASGKSPTSTILLSAAQESGQVIITIMDDGSGIDAAQVRRKAVERGFLRGNEALSDREALNLIFSEGFSTAAAVTELSGRGVGLDVVLKTIGRMNGHIEVESIPGVGTRFVIHLPLTLAIISALLVEVAGQPFALPLTSVVESLRFTPEEVHSMSGQDTLRIRDRIVPLLRLDRLFGLQSDGRRGRYAVVLGRGEKRLAVAVERLKGEQEVVIKGLDPSVSRSAFAVAGATIMGDGSVVLILDVAALFGGRREAPGTAPAPPAAGS
jgi:two-component system chemotaxis sensor kinase CheA